MQMQYTFFGDVWSDPIGNYLSNLHALHVSSKDGTAKDNHKKYFFLKISFSWDQPIFRF